MTYYSCVTVLTVMALGVLCTLVRENDRMSSEKRVLFYVAYAFIAISVIAEWCGVMLDGQGGISEWPLRLAKWADHTFTPLAGGALIWQLRLHNKWEKAFNAILLGNVIIQTAALPFDWIVRVDQMGHYLHGDLYGVYIVAYLAAIVIAAVQLMLYGRSFRRQNHLSLYAIMLLTLVGIGMQEVFGGEVHVAYLSLTLSAAFLFIHNGEYFQLARDEDLVEQRKKIMTDELTGMHSRHAYSLALKELAEEGVPDDLAVFSIDVNGLKEANDTHGHDAAATSLSCLPPWDASVPTRCWRPLRKACKRGANPLPKTLIWPWATRWRRIIRSSLPSSWLPSRTRPCTRRRWPIIGR